MEYALVALLGLIVGSFLNVVIYRTYKGVGFVKGRSYCPFCKHSIEAHDNIPIISFFLLRGKCRWCKKSISWQYPLVEAGMAVAFILLLWQFGPTAEFFVYAVYAMFLMVVFVQDFRYQVILDQVSLPGIPLAILLSLLVLHIPIVDLLIGMAIGGGFFAFQYFVSRGKWIGGGDMRLGTLMGAMLGWKVVLLALFLSYMSGSLFSIGLVLTQKKRWGSRIPLGTFLTAVTFVCFLVGEQLIWWYQAEFL
ncbi:MAG: prepilin peptidase [Parcubacteria group bacterium]